jgi:transcriptional regulator with XRE-family HTH domain
MMRMSAEELGKRVRAARAYAGWSQDELAEKIQVSQPTLARIEKGERQARWIEVMGIAEVTGLPRIWFTGELPSDLDASPETVGEIEKPPNAQEGG